MYVKLLSYSLVGLESIQVEIEIKVNPGIPKFEVIGLPDISIRESKERIFHSIRQFDYKVPPGNITINLAPAELKKKGTNYDLPIALGILLSSKQIDSKKDLRKILIAGELSLDGSIRRVNGIFNTAMSLKEKKYTYLIPCENILELKSLSKNEKAQSVLNMKEAIDFLEGKSIQSENKPVILEFDSSLGKQETKKEKKNPLDFGNVLGQELAKLAIQLSIIGKLNLLFMGPPGCGKSMLMRSITTVLGEINEQEAIEVTKIHLARGEVFEGIIKREPFREVHNTISMHSLIGGGSIPKPGEISLAHKGYLFLDELSEFQSQSIQSLRKPMEEKTIKLDRVNQSVVYPCDFTLLAATNPCRCGYFFGGGGEQFCTCSRRMIQQFYSRISSPFLDRFDIILYIDRIKKKDFEHTTVLTSKEMKIKIDLVKQDYQKESFPYLSMPLKEVVKHYPFCKEIFIRALEKKVISLRKITSVLKVASVLQVMEKEAFNLTLLLKAMEFARYEWPD